MLAPASKEQSYSLTDFLRVAGQVETSCHGVPPLNNMLVTGGQGHPLQHDRETLRYYDKVFQLGTQLTAAANNLGVSYI